MVGGRALPLAIDATSRQGEQVVLAISVLYRGSAIPVAWVVLPHWGKGAWMPHLERLLGLLAPAVPAGMTVLVLTDQGLWSPQLWRYIRENGWHPLMRIRPEATFAPAGQRRQQARELVPGSGLRAGWGRGWPTGMPPSVWPVPWWWCGTRSRRSPGCC